MAVLVSDSFNRADSTTTMGSTDSYNGGTSYAWTVYSPANSAVYGILSNQAYAVSEGSNSSQQFAGINIGQSDAVVTVTFSTISASPYVVLRAASYTSFLQFQAKTTQYVLYYYNGSSWTQLGATSGVTPKTGDVIQVTLQGTSIVAKVNGTQVMSITSSQNQTSTIHGFGGQNASSYFDNFEIDSISSGTTYTGSGTASGVNSLSDTNAFITKGSGTESGMSSITGNGGMLILAATGTASGTESATGNGLAILAGTGTTSGGSSLTTSETFYPSGPTSYAATGTSSGLSSSIVNPVMLMVSGGTAQGISSAIGSATGSGWAKVAQVLTTWDKLNTPITNWTKGG